MSSTWSRIGSTSTSGVPGSIPSGRTHDPGVVGAEPDLVLGEDHPARDLAAQLTLVERPGKPGEHAPGSPTATVAPDAEVPGAAHDLARLALPHVHLAELELVGVRVLSGLDDAPDAEEAEVVAGVGDTERR